MNPVLTIAKWTMYLCALGWVGTFFLMNRLPDPGEVLQELFVQPAQEIVTQDKFQFDYAGQKIDVQPIATYTISGLVASHNDPFAWYMFDLTHDKKSLDTRDVCLIWGSNLKKSDYQKISFHSDDWMCLYEFGSGVYVSEDEISNNHLITDKESIRQVINNLHIGDQVTIKGRLANYSEERWGGRMRNTSASRTDRGDGACEIIFVDDIKVLDSFNAPWVRAHDMFYWGFITLLGLWVLGFLLIPVNLIKESTTM